ncbi:MAG: hypothetical protein K0R80_613 [Clostridia bacterium]|nr:hypothetical protein [Clostridia bacterium]
MNMNKVLIAAGILGFIAAVYMIISNTFYNKDFSTVAIAAGFISPISTFLLWSKDKAK